MCAAPGSKTAQLIEAIHKNEDTLSSGMVVANDADNSRCYMLVHQARRLQSPNFVITNCDASIYPRLSVKDEETGELKGLKFDRVLADVPCSGDGTLRKNVDVWPVGKLFFDFVGIKVRFYLQKWNAANSCNLHGIQYRIAKRGVELLEVGGKMVYSTCSLNPLEDEAVIHRLLKDAGGSLELVDASSLVPGLLYKPGLEEWIVASKDNSFYDKFEDVPDVRSIAFLRKDEKLKRILSFFQKLHSLIRPSMFPPAKEEREEMNLKRCMRILPHQQDTGGFFVAVVRKKALCAWESKKGEEENGAKRDVAEENNSNGNEEAPVAEAGEKRKSGDMDPEAEGEGNPEAKKTRRDRREEERERKKKEGPKKMQGFREDPFVYLSKTEEDEAFAEIKNYFGLTVCQIGFFPGSYEK